MTSRRESWAQQIRKLLRNEPDGLTLGEMCVHINAPYASLYDAAYKMPDAYIDRWTLTHNYVTSEAIWCVVVPPPHCPRPDPLPKERYD